MIARRKKKTKPVLRGEYPMIVQATYSFKQFAMDHIPSLHRSLKGNTELLLCVDLLSGYVIVKAISFFLKLQTIAKSYGECVFRRFEASEAIRHDREPGFMSDFFPAFNRIAGQKQRVNLAHRP